jgi:hypothetical protein
VTVKENDITNMDEYFKGVSKTLNQQIVESVMAIY